MVVNQVSDSPLTAWLTVVRRLNSHYFVCAVSEGRQESIRVTFRVNIIKQVSGVYSSLCDLLLCRSDSSPSVCVCGSLQLFSGAESESGASGHLVIPVVQTVDHGRHALENMNAISVTLCKIICQMHSSASIRRV